MTSIPLMQPYITEKTKQRVCDVLDSGYLTDGPVTRELEKTVADFIGVPHCMAVTSCTTGLEIALRCLGIGPGDEVVVPNYTYPATATAVLMVGATPVIVDVDPDTMNIDYDAAEAAVTERTRAVIPVSLFGNPLDHRRLNSMKEKHGLYILEDSACSLGSSFDGVMTGAHADIAVFSLHPRKFITTGEGGLVTTNNPDWADWMLSFKHFGMDANNGTLSPEFVRMGTNSKLSNIQAAVGLTQMEEVDALLARRIELAQRYFELAKDIDGVRLPTVTKGGAHSYQSCCVFVDHRDEVMATMRDRGVEVQIGTYHLPSLPAFQGDDCRIEGPQDGGLKAFKECLALPLFHGLTEEQQQTVCSMLAETIAQARAAG